MGWILILYFIFRDHNVVILILLLFGGGGGKGGKGEKGKKGKVSACVNTEIHMNGEDTGTGKNNSRMLK